MRFGFSGIAIGIMLAACAEQRPQPIAAIQPQERYAGCAREPCGQPQLSMLSSDITTALRTDSVPVIDVGEVCRGIADQGGATFHDPDLARALHDPETVETQKDCLNSEEHVRDQLMKMWGSFNSSDRTHCITESKMGGESSYTELITCLEMAGEVRKLHEETKSPRSAQIMGQQ